MERAQKIGHGDGSYSIFLGALETNEHIFFRCIKAQHGWAETAIYYKAVPHKNTLVAATSIIDILNGALQKTPQGTTNLFVIYHTCWSLWTHWNDRLCSTRHPTFSPRVTADQARDHIVATAKYSISHKKKCRLLKAAHLILPISPS